MVAKSREARTKASWTASFARSGSWRISRAAASSRPIVAPAQDREGVMIAPLRPLHEIALHAAPRHPARVATVAALEGYGTGSGWEVPKSVAAALPSPRAGGVRSIDARGRRAVGVWSLCAARTTAGVSRRLLLRVVSGRIPPGKLASVTAAVRDRYAAAAVGVAGLERFLVGTWAQPHADQGHGIAFMTLWADLESASDAVGGNLSGLRVLDNVDHGEILERVDYYEVEIFETRRHPGVPRYLRVTAGTVSRGLDADIQRDLRSRLSELPPEVVDAYIGRRVRGPSVEIAFVSAWTDAATVDRLQQPVFPEIADQYDTFWIRLFDVVLEGPTAT
jgi:hypothetical protein